MLEAGLYEQVINKTLRSQLDAITDRLAQAAAIDGAEASRVLARYLAEIIERGLDRVGEEKEGGLRAQLDLVEDLVAALVHKVDRESFEGLKVAWPPEQLLAVVEKENSVYGLDERRKLPRPQTSVARTSLFTGALHEPGLEAEFKREIASADRIDMLVSFIKWSGLRLLMDELGAFAARGGQLRIITTSYMGATDPKAVEELRKLEGARVKVSYDTQSTRLHAKVYVFHRKSGFSTAYVGSSNMSGAALSSGLEWNVKVTAQDLPETLDKIQATFQSYWESRDFEDYDQGQRDRLYRALRQERYQGEPDRPFLFDIRPYGFQQEILDSLQAEREVRGRFKNLIVAATGTGKTVISAFDYQRFCKANPRRPNRLLFIAHREEILRQSLACFQGVLKDPNFGDLFVGSYRPDRLDHLFLSIQTFRSREFHLTTSPDFYDYIVVDEFHHAAAASYQALFDHYRPRILLGLTATPERADGADVLGYFDQRIAAEIRLPEAVERKLLSPFHYFGVTDTVDLADLRWSRGGYEVSQLEQVYALDRAVALRRADHIVRSLDRYVTDLDEVKGLGFCAGVKHAAFMADFFNQRGIPSLCLSGDSPETLRRSAKERLAAGDLRFLFVVDIYNEGVDIPQINTVLFLRPTESLTVFLQQLGRGLRLSQGKDCLTVLDFVGQANRRYNFEDRFNALLEHTGRGLAREIREGFPSLPKGCYIHLERKAQAYILDNIRASFGARAGLLSRLASFSEETGLPLTLSHFADHYHLDIRTIYRKYSFARLCVEAGVAEDFHEPAEALLTRAFRRLVDIDSRRWLTFLLDLLPRLDQLDISALPPLERRMLHMFYATLWPQQEEALWDGRAEARLRSLCHSPTLLAELSNLLRYKFDRIDFIDEPVDLGFDCPLDLHCSYSRDQIFLALDYMKPSAIRQGVKWLPDKKLDVFINTLNKSKARYSPTTMYKDYSISERLFHWQSQSGTSDTSPTAHRYIHHKELGSKVLLFVREYEEDVGGTAPFTFLGLADYVSHEGSKPMSIIWRLHRPIPAKYLKKTNKLLGS